MFWKKRARRGEEKKGEVNVSGRSGVLERTGRKCKKKRKKKKKERCKEMKRLKKFRELFQGVFAKKAEKYREEKVSERRRKQPKVWWTLGKFGKWLFLLLLIGQSWVGADAATEEIQCRCEPMERMQQEMEVKESSWKDAVLRQKAGEDRAEMKKEAKLLRCTLHSGSAWSTERKYIAQNEERRDGEAVQQRSQARMEIRSRRSNNHR